MPRLMIVVGSVRPGRIGLPVAEWVRDAASADTRFDVDFVDLAELALPFMDEPNHPRLRQYTQPHTLAWSARVDAADAFVFVTPEYNYGVSAALKNALDFLMAEWWRKPVGLVSYGGVSSGTRSAMALRPSLDVLGLVPTTVNVEIGFAARQLGDDGSFAPVEAQEKALAAQLSELVELDGALAPLRAAHGG